MGRREVVQQHPVGDLASEPQHGLIERADDDGRTPLAQPDAQAEAAHLVEVAGEVDLVAGTGWLFARDEIERKLDDLFIDEAGQISLANVIAASTSASNIVMLGDPNQLSQPSKGSHPEGADLSALDHVLDGAQTIPDERGRFLTTTWRMHPDVCRFISEIAYENRLESAPECSKQALGGEGEMAGTGLRYRPVVHVGTPVLLRGHVSRRAEQRPRGGQAVVGGVE